MDNKAVFISYVRDDSATVDRIAARLRADGVNVWLDRDNISPGDRWKHAIRTAIREGAYFIACFSPAYAQRGRSFLHEELVVALDELRSRPPDRRWFIPVVLNGGNVPDRDIGGGETLRDIQNVDFSDNWDLAMGRLLQVVSNRNYVTDPASSAEPFIGGTPVRPVEVRSFVGRDAELAKLDDWASQSGEIRVVSIVGLGGLGKSSLAYKWVVDRARSVAPDLIQCWWWGFYDPASTFREFVIETLAAFTDVPRHETRERSLKDNARHLIKVLDSKNLLLVLDGAERLLGYYRPAEEESLNPGNASDDAAVQFLKDLARTQRLRTIICSRLYPADLQDRYTRNPVPGSQRLDLSNLNEQDAATLWQQSTGRERDNPKELTALFQTFGSHTLHIQALAGDIKQHRPERDNFHAWKSALEADLSKYSMANNVKDVQDGILKYVLRRLTDPEKEVLYYVAVLSRPVPYNVLLALFAPVQSTRSPDALSDVLSELEARDLLHAVKRPGTVSSPYYDEHPIVRMAVLRDVVAPGMDRELCDRAFQYFQSQIPTASLPAPRKGLPLDPTARVLPEIQTIEHVALQLMAFYVLVHAQRYEDAWVWYRAHLMDVIYYRLGDTSRQIALLRMLLPETHFSTSEQLAGFLSALAQGYHLSGSSGESLAYFQRYNDIMEQSGDWPGLTDGLLNIAEPLRITGKLRKSAQSTRQALALVEKHHLGPDMKAEVLYPHGRTLATCGQASESAKVLYDVLRIRRKSGRILSEAVTYAALAQRSLWLGRPRAALKLAERSKKVTDDAPDQRSERQEIRVRRLLGTAKLRLGDSKAAKEYLQEALFRSRA